MRTAKGTVGAVVLAAIVALALPRSSATEPPSAPPPPPIAAAPDASVPTYLDEDAKRALALELADHLCEPVLPLLCEARDRCGCERNRSCSSGASRGCARF